MEREKGGNIRKSKGEAKEIRGKRKKWVKKKRGTGEEETQREKKKRKRQREME